MNMKLNRIITLTFCLIALISCNNKTQDSEVVVSWIADSEPSNRPVSMFGDVPQEIIEELGLQDGVSSSMSAVLVQVADKDILFDAGLGSPGSYLLPTLDSLGVDPKTLEIIYITHLHPDHIGGLMNPDNFPNAEIWLSKIEYDAWKSMPEGSNAQQLNFFEIYKDRLHLFDFEDELADGIKAFHAPGHTPGHSVFQVGEYLIIGDLMHGAPLQIEYPEYCPTFDMDKETAVASRKKFIQYARDNGLTMVGMHTPAPGFIK